jgi:oxygen-independent coproporphyrinogen III oxidase
MREVSTFDLLGNRQHARVGIYFHIPFCPHICPYCDFTKTSRFSKKGVASFFARCLLSLRKQIPLFLEYQKAFATNSSEKPFTTVYFGGGTPGLFSADFFAPLVEEIRRHFTIEEMTLETNPYTNIERRWADYAQLGIQRVTLGAQSQCPRALQFLGRKHTPAEILDSLEGARAAGIEQVQMDLIYGLPLEVRTLSVGDELALWKNHGATGVSTYALTLEARTPFGKSQSPKTDEENSTQEYARLYNAAASAGFVQRETSNFSLYEAKHNNIYWYGLPYLGIGTGAHGLSPFLPPVAFGRRYQVGASQGEWAPGDDKLSFESQEQGEELFALQWETERTSQDWLDEMIFTLLRTPTGLPQLWLETFCTPDSLIKMKNHPKIQRGLAEGLLVWKEAFHIAGVEKLRGDTWCADVASLLEPYHFR